MPGALDRHDALARWPWPVTSQACRKRPRTSSSWQHCGTAATSQRWPASRPGPGGGRACRHAGQPYAVPGHPGGPRLLVGAQGPAHLEVSMGRSRGPSCSAAMTSSSGSLLKVWGSNRPSAKRSASSRRVATFRHDRPAWRRLSGGTSTASTGSAWRRYERLGRVAPHAGARPSSETAGRPSAGRPDQAPYASRAVSADGVKPPGIAWRSKLSWKTWLTSSPSLRRRKRSGAQ